MGPSAIAATIPTVRALFFFYNTTTKAAAGRETADHRHDAQWQWCARYRPCLAGQFGHGHRRAQKKEPTIKQVNERLLKSFDPAQLDIILRQVEAAEMDEMWSFVGSKSQPRWLWHAIEHHTGQPNAAFSAQRKVCKTVRCTAQGEGFSFFLANSHNRKFRDFVMIPRNRSRTPE